MAAHSTELRHELPPAPRVTKTLISVRYRNGAYQTTTVHGQRASSTASYETAARVLANKLHPHSAWQLTLVVAEQGTQVFELEVKPASSKTDPGCFGVGCPKHAECSRYAAVEGDQADMQQIITTCLSGDGERPLFIVISTSKSAS